MVANFLIYVRAPPAEGGGAVEVRKSNHFIWRVPERLGTSLENSDEVKLYRVRLPGSPPLSQTDTESGDSVRITPAAVNRCIGRGDLCSHSAKVRGTPLRGKSVMTKLPLRVPCHG